MSALRTLVTAQPGTDRALRRRRIRQTWGRPWLYLSLFGCLLLMMAPFLWMLSGSFKPEADITRQNTLLRTQPATAHNPYFGPPGQAAPAGHAAARTGCPGTPTRIPLAPGMPNPTLHLRSSGSITAHNSSSTSHGFGRATTPHPGIIALE